MTVSLSVRNTSVSPAKVREWARANGLPVGTRGKFDAEVIKAYNKSHRGSLRYVPAGYKVVATKEVRIGSKTRKIAVPSARELLRQAGEPVGKRGRLSAQQVARALEIAKTLDD